MFVIIGATFIIVHISGHFMDLIIFRRAVFVLSIRFLLAAAVLFLLVIINFTLVVFVLRGDVFIPLLWSDPPLLISCFTFHCVIS